MAYVLLLIKDLADLEPYVGLTKWTWGVAEDVPETVQGSCRVAFLLVDDAQPEVNLVGLFKV